MSVISGKNTYLHVDVLSTLAHQDSVLSVQALCIFTGRACLACDRIDVSSICQYVADTLKQAESYDLLVLRSIVEDMTVGQLHLPAKRFLRCCLPGHSTNALAAPCLSEHTAYVLL